MWKDIVQIQLASLYKQFKKELVVAALVVVNKLQATWFSKKNQAFNLIL